MTMLSKPRRIFAKGAETSSKTSSEQSQSQSKFARQIRAISVRQAVREDNAYGLGNSGAFGLMHCANVTAGTHR